MQNAKDLSKEKLISIMTGVFDSMLEVGIQAGNGHMDLESGDRMTLASVSITGGWSGVVFLLCPCELASELGQAMFKCDAATISKADIQDAMGEIINMVGGNVKANLPGPSSLSLPNVVQGSEFSWNVPGGQEVQRIYSRCKDKDLMVTVVRDTRH
jgi:CheY-specific phosphatase CheX